MVPTYYFKLKSKEFNTYVVFKGGTSLTEGTGLTATSLDLIAASDDENAVKTYVSQIGIASSVISSDKKKAEVKANVGMIFIPFTITGANANTDELKLDASLLLLWPLQQAVAVQNFNSLVSPQKTLLLPT